MATEQDLTKEIKSAYQAKDLIWCYELCNELYELKAFEKSGKQQKFTLKGLIAMEIAGQKPSVDDIITTVNGLIELAIASKQ